MKLTPFSGRFDATLYTTANGLPSNVCTGGALRDEQGLIWIATTGGVAIYDAREIVPARSAPFPLVLERLQVNGAERAATPGLTLDHHETTLTIDLASRSTARSETGR